MPVINGTSGDDTLNGTPDADIINGLEGNDTIDGAAGDDMLNGGDGNDDLSGGTGADTFYGDAGDDTLRGNDSDLALYGGTGNDFYWIGGLVAGPAIIELANEGTDTVRVSTIPDYTLPGNIENGILGGAVTNTRTLRGNGMNNSLTGYIILHGNTQLYGGDGDDTLANANSMYGEAGNDTLVSGFDMYGGPGDDTYYPTNSLHHAIETVDNGYDTIRVAGDGTGTGNVELLMVDDPTTTNNAWLTGNGSLEVRGNAGNNTIVGGSSAVTLVGYGGDDTYVLSAGAEIIVEATGGGYDRIYASVSYTLNAGASVEAISPVDSTATTPLAFGGNELAQSIAGNRGNNILAGYGGYDLLTGGEGDDIYLLAPGAHEYIVELENGGRDVVYTFSSYTLNAGTQLEVLAPNGYDGTTPLTMAGNELAQTIYGNAGSNVLFGGGGADVLVGLGGDDIYLLSGGQEQIFEYADQGRDVVYTLTDYTLATGAHVEVLAPNGYDGTASLTLAGNELAQTIYGNAGNNVLFGGGSADVLVGLGGDDVYLIGDAAAVVIEAGGQGRDVVYSSVSFGLAAGQSVEVLAPSDYTGTAALGFTGNELAQVIYGNAGANVVNGGGGADTLVGLGGADQFAFTSALGGGNVDFIYDFAVGTDKVALDDAVFGGLAPGALATGAFYTGASAHDADDRVVYDQASGVLYFDADGNGAGAAVQFATLTAGINLTSADFVVI